MTSRPVRQSHLTNRVRGPLPWGELLADNAGEVRPAIANNDQNVMEVRYRDISSTRWIEIENQPVIGDEDSSNRLSFVGFSRDNLSFYYLATGPHRTN